MKEQISKFVAIRESFLPQKFSIIWYDTSSSLGFTFPYNNMYVTA